MRIFAFHLLNDYSGSPKVLMQLVKGWTADFVRVHLVTCNGREGFLSNLAGVHYEYFWYKFVSNKILRALFLILSQVHLIISLLFKIKRDDVIYVNTVLPFGAAILGKLIGCRVIYHIHETSIRPAILKKFLFGIANRCANDIIYVSKYLATQENVNKVENHILYNAIENDFYRKACENRELKNTLEHVLMVCSLKEYKGVNEYVRLASENLNLKFRLVLNASQEEIDDYLVNHSRTNNLEIYPTQTNLHPFYQWADLVTNLSRPDGWIETFGLTIIEGMAYGCPSIVPPVGGIAEIVEEGTTGFKIDCRNTELITQKLQQLYNSPKDFSTLQNNVLKKIASFDENAFFNTSLDIVSEELIFHPMEYHLLKNQPHLFKNKGIRFWQAFGT